MRDFQRQKVYDWEREVIHPRCPQTVKFVNAQAFVDGIWLAEGLLYPPRVERMPQQATKVLATGCRGELRLREVTPSWVIIHELAHTLTLTLTTAHHGPDYVGCYIRLLDKYMGVPLALSMFTLDRAGIKFNLWAKPCFIDNN